MTGRTVAHFLKTEAGGGMLLAFAALLALFVANSPLSGAYFDALKTRWAPIDLKQQPISGPKD